MGLIPEPRARLQWSASPIILFTMAKDPKTEEGTSDNRVSAIMDGIPPIIHALSIAFIAHELLLHMGAFSAFLIVLMYMLKR